MRREAPGPSIQRTARVKLQTLCLLFSSSSIEDSHGLTTIPSDTTHFAVSSESSLLRPPSELHGPHHAPYFPLLLQVRATQSVKRHLVR